MIFCKLQNKSDNHCTEKPKYLVKPAEMCATCNFFFLCS